MNCTPANSSRCLKPILADGIGGSGQTPAKQSTSQQKLTVEQLTKLRRKKFKEKIASTEAQLVKQLISPYVDDLEETKQNSH